LILTSVERRISRRTRAVMYVSLGGNAAELIKIKNICDKHRLIFIYDAAQSAGSRYRGRHSNCYADDSVFSFQALKNLPPSDAGLVPFRTERELELAKQLDWCAISKKNIFERNKTGYVWDYSVTENGWKYYGNVLTAAIVLVQLRYLDRDNIHRREIARQY
jgi:dTDP-4-amino-4,6-dideoxygalactose transaminase